MTNLTTRRRTTNRLVAASPVMTSNFNFSLLSIFAFFVLFALFGCEAVSCSRVLITRPVESSLSVSKPIKLIQADVNESQQERETEVVEWRHLYEDDYEDEDEEYENEVGKFLFPFRYPRWSPWKWNTTQDTHYS